MTMAVPDAARTVSGVWFHEGSPGAAAALAIHQPEFLHKPVFSGLQMWWVSGILDR